MQIQCAQTNLKADIPVDCCLIKIVAKYYQNLYFNLELMQWQLHKDNFQENYQDLPQIDDSDLSTRICENMREYVL